jgi:histidinol dehydrogenase
VFIGPFSPEAAGDYASGPNHVLPTSGAARLRGGLAVTDYLKVISVQQLAQAALQRLAPAITTLARAEGLEAHARSVEIRLMAEGRSGRRAETRGSDPQVASQ